MARGIVTLIDSINFFVQAQDVSTSVLSVSASATGTYNGADIANTLHKGGTFFFAISTIAATCTVHLNVQAKDPVSNGYFTFANISLDGVTTGNIGNYSFQVYPGIITTTGSGLGVNDFHHNGIFPAIMRVQASITATASAGGAAFTMTTGLSKTV